MPPRAGHRGSLVPARRVDLARRLRRDTAAETQRVLVLAVIFWLVRPIGLGILVGTLHAFLPQPACKRLTGRIGAHWAVLTTVIVSGAAVTVPLGGTARAPRVTSLYPVFVCEVFLSILILSFICELFG